jgi:hypothetical protein
MPERREAMKKYQFTHPIAAIPAMMTSHAIPDISISNTGMGYLSIPPYPLASLSR